MCQAEPISVPHKSVSVWIFPSMLSTPPLSQCLKLDPGGNFDLAISLFILMDSMLWCPHICLQPVIRSVFGFTPLWDTAAQTSYMACRVLGVTPSSLAPSHASSPWCSCSRHSKQSIPPRNCLLHILFFFLSFCTFCFSSMEHSYLLD